MSISRLSLYITGTVGVHGFMKKTLGSRVRNDPSNRFSLEDLRGHSMGFSAPHTSRRDTSPRETSSREPLSPKSLSLSASSSNASVPSTAPTPPSSGCRARRDLGRKPPKANLVDNELSELMKYRLPSMVQIWGALFLRGIGLFRVPQTSPTLMLMRVGKFLRSYKTRKMKIKVDFTKLKVNAVIPIS